MTKSIQRHYPFPPASVKPHSRYRKTPERCYTVEDAVAAISALTEAMPQVAAQIAATFQHFADACAIIAAENKAEHSCPSQAQ